VRLDFEFLFDAAFVVAAGAQNPWARRRRAGLAELVNEPWILAPRTTALGSIAMEAFRASGLEYPRTTVFVLPTEVRANLLMTGRYLTILADFALRFPVWRSAIKVLPIQLPLDRMQVGVVTLKNRTVSPVVRLFIDAAHDIAKPLAKGK
jgi:DNA-binding transcriptional LysR family regulator